MCDIQSIKILNKISAFIISSQEIYRCGPDKEWSPAMLMAASLITTNPLPYYFTFLARPCTNLIEWFRSKIEKWEILFYYEQYPKPYSTRGKVGKHLRTQLSVLSMVDGWTWRKAKIQPYKHVIVPYGAIVAAI